MTDFDKLLDHIIEIKEKVSANDVKTDHALERQQDLHARVDDAHSTLQQHMGEDKEALARIDKSLEHLHDCAHETKENTKGFKKWLIGIGAVVLILTVAGQEKAWELIKAIA